MKMADITVYFPFDYYNIVENDKSVTRSHVKILYAQTKGVEELGAIENWQTPFVLVTGSSDNPTSTIDFLLQNPNMLHWFSENVDILSDRVTAIPIGVNLWHQGQVLNSYYTRKSSSKLKKFTLLLNFRIETNHDLRWASWKYYCENKNFSWVLCTTTWRHPNVNNSLSGNYAVLKSTYDAVISSRYTLCPPGNGMDTHRIYEALHLGSIPVVQRGLSPKMDDLYQRLPVLMVDSLRGLTHSFLMSHYAALHPLVLDWNLHKSMATFKRNINDLVIGFNISSIGYGQASMPYPINKLSWGQHCQRFDNSLSTMTKKRKWRAVFSANLNAGYLGFVPSVSDHWRKHGLHPSLALVAHAKNSRTIRQLVGPLKRMATVTVFNIPSNLHGIPEGHVGKLARAYLATTFGNEVVTIVDVDYYLIWFPEWKRHFDCVPATAIFGRGFNMYASSPDEGKFPMYLTTALSSTFKSFLNPDDKSFPDWLSDFRGMRHFDAKEDPFGSYGTFSDESLFRALLFRRPTTVFGVDHPKSWYRIDRAYTAPLQPDELASASDVFPNRPIFDCTTFTARTERVHKFLRIHNPERELRFFNLLVKLGIEHKEWGGTQDVSLHDFSACVNSHRSYQGD